MNPAILPLLQQLASELGKLPDNQDGYTYTIYGPGGSPYLTRTLLPRVGDHRPVLHHIHRADLDRDLHNHPWVTASFLILSGGYTEERLIGNSIVRRTLKAGDINELNAATYHRIAELHGDVWTMGIFGHRTGRDWGFLVNGVFVPHHEYKSANFGGRDGTSKG